MNCQCDTVVLIDNLYICETCCRTVPQRQYDNVTDPTENNRVVGASYKRLSHLLDVIKELRCTLYSTPNKVIANNVLDKLFEKGVVNPYYQDIRSALKKLGYPNNHKTVSSLVHVLSPNRILNVTEDQIEDICYIFNRIQGYYDIHCPGSRLNFLSYPYVLKRILDLLGIETEAIKILRDKKRKALHDDIWCCILTEFIRDRIF